MANFLVIVTQDPRLRAEVMDRAGHGIAPVTGLAIDSIDAQGCATLWAAHPTAPVTRHTADGGFALCFGEPRDDAGDAPKTASDLDRIWWRENPTASFDGFFAGIVWHPTRGLIVGTDIMGIFPVYHCQLGDTLLVSSSPAMLRTHPRFEARIDNEGLAGILLTQGIVGHRTMLQSVSRLLPGRSLRYSAQGQLSQPMSFALEPNDSRFHMPVRKQLDLIYDVLDAATNRPINKQLPHLILLSGGRDSRMVAGLAHRHGLTANALSLGVADDLEVQFARMVADELRWPHHFTEVATPDRLPASVQTCMTYEMLAGGMDSPNSWALVDNIRSLGQRVLTGLTLDSLIGGSHMMWLYDEQAGTFDLSQYRNMVLKYGIPAGEVANLFHQHDGHAIVQGIIASLDQWLDSYPGHLAQKSVCFDLHHRQRLHVGSWMWQLSFAAWPMTPGLDRNLVRTCLSLPPNLLMNRYAQEEIMIRRMPALAEIPIDRNSQDMWPLKVPFRDELRKRMAQRFKPLARWIRPRPPQGTSRWQRVYNFDNDAWRAVRHVAEPYRAALGDVLDRSTIDRLMPAPNESLNAANVFTGGAGRRMLLALMLYAGAQGRQAPPSR
jgi:asparagine synthase (glutamine-hydrolysing)